MPGRLSEAMRQHLSRPNEGDPTRTNADLLVDVWTEQARGPDPRWFRLLLDVLPGPEAQALARRVADRLARES